jgi:peptide/nickel transport system permease protein
MANEPMLRAARRMLHSLLLVTGVSAVSFVLLALAPGNFFDELRLNPQISAQTIAHLKAQYGMDRPLPVRYALWVESLAKGEMGYSVEYQRPVGSLIWPRAKNTLLLTATATFLAWLVALAWGLLEALKQGSWLDRAGGFCTALLLAIPDVPLGLLLLLFAAKSGWFPAGGMISLETQDKPNRLLIHLVLPVVALTLGALPLLVRHVRSAMIVALHAPFVQAAKAHGISNPRLILRYVFPAAMNSLISLLGFSIGGLLSMSLLIEVVLGWPGLGPLVLEAMLSRDTYVVMAAVMLSSLFLVLGNFVADALLYWNDPRIREAAA